MGAQTPLTLLSILVVCRYGAATNCLLLVNKCVTHCPRNMHPYHTRCDRDTISQRTCEEPYVYNLGFTCGWSRCDCNGDLLMDETTATCVDMRTCAQSKNRPGGRRRRPDRKASKKLRIHENLEWPDK